jgi:hypothetical protein
MLVTHPAGSGASTTISAPFKAKSAKSSTAKAPRRKTEAGMSSMTAVIDPPKQSPLRVLSAICEHHGWHVAYGKAPCLCEIWDNRCANVLIVWRGLEHRSWCTCIVAKMSQEQMLEVIA